MEGLAAEAVAEQNHLQKREHCLDADPEVHAWPDDRQKVRTCVRQDAYDGSHKLLRLNEKEDEEGCDNSDQRQDDHAAKEILRSMYGQSG